MKNYSHYVYMINSLEKPEGRISKVRSALIDSRIEYSDLKDYLDRNLYRVNNRVVSRIIEYARQQGNSARR